MNRVSRTVKNDSTLSIKNMQFDAPMQFMRQSVEVRFLPDRLSEAYIFDNVSFAIVCTINPQIQYFQCF